MIGFVGFVEFIEFIGDDAGDAAGADAPADGALDFSDTENSGLIVALFEDI